MPRHSPGYFRAMHGVTRRCVFVEPPESPNPCSAFKRSVGLTGPYPTPRRPFGGWARRPGSVGGGREPSVPVRDLESLPDAGPREHASTDVPPSRRSRAFSNGASRMLRGNTQVVRSREESPTSLPNETEESARALATRCPLSLRLRSEAMTNKAAAGASQRHAPCPCGPGGKYKHCCGRPSAGTARERESLSGPEPALPPEGPAVGRGDSGLGGGHGSASPRRLRGGNDSGPWPP
jgi:hypothetical protein